MSLSRGALLVALVAAACYANALGNDFAYDDNEIILHNPVVTTPELGQALLGPYWRRAREGSGLYRPVTLAAFATEWSLFGGSPLGFHAVNLVGHVAVSLLVLALLAVFVTPSAAVAGALLFALHPVHVEAVANVVGQGELLAAAAYLMACLLYLRGAGWGPAGRAVRLAGVAGLYLVGLGAKEIAVTLPAALVLLEWFRTAPEPPARRIRRELPLLTSLVAVLGGYLLLRWSVLGTVTGEVAAPALRGLTGGQRILSGLSVWPEYVRLFLWPVDLSADYAPGVLRVARSVTPAVVAGAGTLVLLAVAAGAARRRMPPVSLGILWFAVAVLPVSNLVVAAGVLLAERTLYLPSVGWSFVVAGLVAAIPSSATERARRGLSLAGLAVGAALMIRTVTRNPTWMNTFTVLNTLAVEHPESYLALRARAAGLVRVGEVEKARASYEAAVALAPRHYGLLVEVGGFYGRLREYPRAEELLRQAIAVTPDQPSAYRLLAEQYIRRGMERKGHRTALEGLARAGPDRELWALVSESYIAKGDLEAAIRARRAALGQDPESAADWARLAELLDAVGRTRDAREARARYEELTTSTANSEP